MEKKECAIVFGITNNYMFAFCNVLLGMKKHCKVFWDDIIVLHTDVTPENMKIANQIFECKFVEVEDDGWCDKLNQNIDQNIVKMYSIATMFRYECFNLLKTYKKVIWSDVDLLIQGDFSGMADYGEKTGYAACISDGFAPLEMSFKETVPGYNMFTPNYNAGTLVVSDKLKNYEKMCDWCKEKTIELANILDMPDQGILNLMIQEFGIEPEVIDPIKYQCHPLWPEALNAEKAPVLHAYGVRKFWNDVQYKKMFPEWIELNEEYIQLCNNVAQGIEVEVPGEPLVSVVMSVFNRYDFLDEAVQSILDQTYSNFEFIIVLEHCPEQGKIEEILKQKNDDRIIIVKNTENLGFSASLNVGIDLAKGKYIARMDDDDISYPERFEKQVSFLERYPNIGILGTHAETFMNRHDLWNNYPTDSEYAKVELLRGTVLCHPTVMMRLKELNKHNLRYSPDAFTEDYDLWARAAQYMEISNIPEVLFGYRSSGSNITLNRQYVIHYSHLKVMEYQLRNYLKLDPTMDELSLLNGRIPVVDMVYTKNKTHANKVLNDFKKKILEANKKEQFYNQEKLANYLGVKSEVALQASTATVSFKEKVGKVLTKIFKPFVDTVVHVFSWRIYDLINIRAEQTNRNMEQVLKKIEDMNLEIAVIQEEIKNNNVNKEVKKELSEIKIEKAIEGQEGVNPYVRLVTKKVRENKNEIE